MNYMYTFYHKELSLQTLDIYCTITQALSEVYNNNSYIIPITDRKYTAKCDLVLLALIIVIMTSF